MPPLLAVAAGGVAGTLARFAISGALYHPHVTFPRATLLVNLAGSLALGFVLQWAGLSEEAAPALRAGLAVGFCGAFTTMSTFSWELLRLLQDRQHTLAALYLGATVGGCLLAAWLGWRLGAGLAA